VPKLPVQACRTARRRPIGSLADGCRVVNESLPERADTAVATTAALGNWIAKLEVRPLDHQLGHQRCMGSLARLRRGIWHRLRFVWGDLELTRLALCVGLLAPAPEQMNPGAGAGGTYADDRDYYDGDHLKEVCGDDRRRRRRGWQRRWRRGRWWRGRRWRGRRRGRRC